MTFEMGTLIAFILAVVGGAVAYGRLARNVEENTKSIDKNKDEQDKELNNVWKVVGDFRKKLEDHEIESGQVRLQIEKDLGMIRQSAIKGDGRFDIIMSQLEDIKKKIDKLEMTK